MVGINQFIGLASDKGNGLAGIKVILTLLEVLDYKLNPMLGIGNEDLRADVGSISAANSIPTLPVTLYTWDSMEEDF